MLKSQQVQHLGGHFPSALANISRVNSEALCELVRIRRPKLVVEIGMAYGVSTLSIRSDLQGECIRADDLD